MMDYIGGNTVNAAGLILGLLFIFVVVMIGYTVGLKITAYRKKCKKVPYVKRYKGGRFAYK